MAESDRGSCFHIGAVLRAEADERLEIVPEREQHSRGLARSCVISTRRLLLPSGFPRAHRIAFLECD